MDTFGGYIELALELGVPVDRIDAIIDFEAAERYGVKTEGNAAGASPEVLDAPVREVQEAGFVVGVGLPQQVLGHRRPPVLHLPLSP